MLIGVQLAVLATSTSSAASNILVFHSMQQKTAQRNDRTAAPCSHAYSHCIFGRHRFEKRSMCSG